MNRLRSMLFTGIFFGLSVPVVLLAPVAALIGQPALIAWTKVWTGLHRWCARLILGVRTRTEGERSAQPVLYAVKHQAMYETLELTLLLDAPAIVMKQELASIPVWGWCARRYGLIVIDRESAGGALRRMVREAHAAVAKGRSIVIFPEGTRVVPGDSPPLRAGFAGLYRMLGLPVIPVALDSGLTMPRHGPKRPGTVTFRFGEPIPPGLSREEAEARVHRAINALEGVE